jgi:hypothetical protein
MRPTRVAGLVMVWVLINATWAFAQVKADSQFREAKPRAGTRLVSEENASNMKWEADGFGLTEKDAENVALEQVRNEIADYLFQNGLRDWRPEVSDIRASSTPIFRNKEKTFDDPELGKMQRVTVVVELTPKAIREFQKEARHQRAGNRMMATSKGLGMLVALLVALGGYFKLEEATKGYYTTWLRLSTLGFIGAVATSLWILA